jgi:2-polyprenyl-6-methoxyphenol hydroxylase-like FAD-dependent oxidoreductase
MLLTNKKIAIVGGGPGALTLARLLQLSGAQVTIYERDASPTARVQGATLDLHEDSGLKALEKAGLTEAFQANFRPDAGRIRITDQQAVIRLDQHLDNACKEDRPEIDRGPLRQILLNSLQPDTVVWNRRFKSMSPARNGWQLEFESETGAYADVVIAADGANSKLRPYLTPVKPFYAGLTVLEGNVDDAVTLTPKINALLKGGKIFAFGNSKLLIVSSKGDGSISYYLGFKADENWTANCGIDFNDKGQVTQWFESEYAGWAPLWTELLANTAYIIPRPQYCMPLDQTWPALPNLTMLGDAAHLMPPYAGEGVNMAMLDALELNECLTNMDFENISSAIAYYEQKMRERAAEVAQVTLDSTAMLHSPDASEQMVQMFNTFEG